MNSSEVLARHRRQGDAEVFGVGTRLKRDMNRPPSADDLVAAARGPFLAHDDHAVLEGMLQHRRVGVPPAVLVDEEVQRIVSVERAAELAQQLRQRSREDGPLATPLIEQGVESGGADRDAAHRPAYDARPFAGVSKATDEPPHAVETALRQ
jgi:hypothetical protein